MKCFLSWFRDNMGYFWDVQTQRRRGGLGMELWVPEIAIYAKGVSVCLGEMRKIVDYVIASPFSTYTLQSIWCAMNLYMLQIFVGYVVILWWYSRSCTNARHNLHLFDPWRPEPSCKFLRATSHTRLRARDHYTSSTLIGGKGGAGPSSLHTTLGGPMEHVTARWMWSLHGSPHDIEWIMVHGHLDCFQKPPLGGRPNMKPGGSCHSERSQPLAYSTSSRMRTHMNRSSLK